MIISRSPLRITLGGGGTDLPSYYREHGGFLVAAAIDKFVYATLGCTFEDQLVVRHHDVERVARRAEIKHPIIRESLDWAGIDETQIEITTLADVPGGTGLGSSGSLTTALIQTLSVFQGTRLGPRELAETAVHIELEKLGQPIGKQDQYIAAFGGLTVFEFRTDDTVDIRPLEISPEAHRQLSNNLLLFSTGSTRSTSKILQDQDDKTKNRNAEMIEHLHFVKELGRQSCAALESGEVARFGELMHTHWEHKKKRSTAMSNPEIDAWYEAGRRAGALGGKVVGAGGGGFLMFYAEDPQAVRIAMQDIGLRELNFQFESCGTKTIEPTSPTSKT